MFKKKSIHFIGIGGIGMSAIAEILNKIGFKISGSDINQNNITKKLLKKGIKVYKKHSWKNINNSDMVVYSSAIKQNNEELKFAKLKKIPALSRASMLAEVMRLKSSITIAGSHGKTTTTSLLATILETANLDPTIINGGIINKFNTNAKLGKGEWIVAEADESDGSFVCLPSTIGVINNIDLEHLDYYKNIGQIKNAFLDYAKNIPFYGFLALCIDNKNVRDVKKKLFDKKIFTFGLSNKADFYADKIKNVEVKNQIFTKFDIVINLDKVKIIKDLIIPLIGNHNIQNVLGAVCVAKGLTISDSHIRKALKSYQGVKRRFSILFKNKSNMVIDDYAHHPVEIKKTINSLELITKGKVFSIFEPHRVSRVSSLLEDFISSFKKSDYIYVLPIYSAGEDNKKNINHSLICNILKKKYKNKTIKAYKTDKQLFEHLNQNICDGDNIIFLGAGKSSQLAEEFSKNFSATNV